jgi:asparagine synthase (glutamine-hydrolysing)
MCGICGQTREHLFEERLRTAMTKLEHRGPDQEGMWFGADIMLGHRRLSIIDLSDAGTQPMANENGEVRLVFNGEVYNFAELRHLLEGKHVFGSRTDSEVLVHGYEEWGISGLLERIRGMFAFAIWDEGIKSLYVARDHLGKKPVFYSFIGGGLSFASTLPALLDLLGTTPEVSSQAVIDYLAYKYVPAPTAIFEGVFKLPPAYLLELRLNCRPRLTRYWRPDFSRKENLSESEWLERIDGSLKDAVRDRLVADVPLGAFLSGGVDSSLVVALMTELSGRPVTTISTGFEDHKLDELPYARKVADVCGADNHEYILHPGMADILPEVVFQFGEPFADSAALPTYYLAKMARQHVKVVLTGDGGDENFAGYPTAQAIALASALRPIPGVASGHIAFLLGKLEKLGPKGVRNLRAVAEFARGENGNYVHDPLGTRNFRDCNYEFYGPALRSCVSCRDPDDAYRALWEESGEIDWVDRALYVDMLATLPNDFLVKVDAMTMAHGLEARCPFLDIRLVDLASKIPPRLKLGKWGTKYLLKKLAGRYLPKEVIYRPKHGFLVPIADWLRNSLVHMLGPILLSKKAQSRGYFMPESVRRLVAEHENGKSDHGGRLWLLLMLELWFRMFIERELSREANLIDLIAEVRSKGKGSIIF